MAIITISRGSGSGGLLLAEGLAKELGYDIISREDIVHEAACYGIPEEKLQKAMIEPPGFWERFKHHRRHYLAIVQAALCECVQKDNVVYHGHAGHLLLRGVSHVLRLHLLAPMSFRTRMVINRDGSSQEAAVRYIADIDRQRRDWTFFLYGVNWLDPSLYDLVINLENFEPQEAVEVVATAVRQKQFEATEESRRMMADLVLASRVRASLVTNRDTAAAEVEVHAREGVVFLKGQVRHESLVQDIIRVAEGVEGVSEVNREDLAAPDYNV